MKRNQTSDKIPQQGKHEHPLPQEISQTEKQNASNALEQAEEDMEKDPEFSSQNPNDDLDEGEAARLVDDRKDLV